MAKAPAATTIGPTSAVQAPWMTRESTSRPRRSVPARNSAEGGLSPTASRWVKGESGAIAAPKIAQITTTAMISMATMTDAGIAPQRVAARRAPCCAGRAHDGTRLKRMRGSISA